MQSGTTRILCRPLPKLRAGLFLTQYTSIKDRYDMADTATLSAKFQISIPKAIRAAQHWQAGQEFAFIPKGSGVMLVPVPDVSALAGIAKGAKGSSYRDRSDRY